MLLLSIFPNHHKVLFVKLTSVTISDAIDTLPAGTFKNCVNLKEITLPETLEEISESLFIGCLHLF